MRCALQWCFRYTVSAYDNNGLQCFYSLTSCQTIGECLTLRQVALAVILNGNRHGSQHKPAQDNPQRLVPDNQPLGLQPIERGHNLRLSPAQVVNQCPDVDAHQAGAGAVRSGSQPAHNIPQTAVVRTDVLAKQANRNTAVAIG
tara:strand:- start:273 stop:704 length:432 start_codon:yes stop_codon:yes gene_type:complete